MNRIDFVTATLPARKRIALVPGRLEQIWQESDQTGVSPDQVADRMAQELIGR